MNDTEYQWLNDPEMVRKLQEAYQHINSFESARLQELMDLTPEQRGVYYSVEIQLR
jgi:hypothetical protein